jgi:hypothetical protein
MSGGVGEEKFNEEYEEFSQRITNILDQLNQNFSMKYYS